MMPDQRKNKSTVNNLNEKKHSIVLLQGVFADTFFQQFKKNNSPEVFLMEGRPNLAAASANARNLLQKKIIPTMISDNMAGFLFLKDLVKEVWIAHQAADRDGALCDTGALVLGVLGKHHHIPVYLFPSVPSGRKTNFMGKEKNLTRFKNKTIAPKGIRAYVPLVEWLPAKYITKIFPSGQSPAKRKPSNSFESEDG